jgi:DNA repair protein RecO (recombination protein O)
MPTDHAEAIVLRTSAIGEQDKLVGLLTRDKGVLRGVAKGARKFGNRFGSALEPMSHIDVRYYEKERRELVTISGCDLVQSFFDIRSDPATVFTLDYFAELVEEFLPARFREDVVFRLLLSTLQALESRGDVRVLGRYFEAWILMINGFLPDVHRCRKCRKPLKEPGWLSPRRDGIYCDVCAPARRDEARPELGRFLSWVRKHPPAEAPGPPFTAAELRSIERSLQAMIIYHLEREPRSLRFVRNGDQRK